MPLSQERIDELLYKEQTKDERINTILNFAGDMLKDEGVKYFICVVDRQPEAEDAAMQTHEDPVRLGMWVGQMLNTKK